MADREFVFGRDDVQTLLKEHFIVVAADDWYQRRREDEVGRFFRGVANQSPRKGKGGSTRQGRYAFTASGKLLGYNNNRDPQRILNMLRSSISKFKALPPNDTKPGAVKVPALPVKELDERYARLRPKGPGIVKVYTRVLEKDSQGNYQHCGQPGNDSKSFRHKGHGTATDHLWIRPDEFKQLLNLAKGSRKPTPVPPPIAMRIARFHLVDNTRGEPNHWKRHEVKSLHLTATRRAHGLTLNGSFHLETKDGKRGYEGSFGGSLKVSPKSGKPFLKLIAMGDHWGEGTYTGKARPGKNPLAVAFTLTDSSKRENQVPPQAIRWEQGYYEAHRH